MAKLEIEIGAVTTGLTQGLKDAESKLQSFGKKAQDIGKTLSLSVTAPLTAFAAITIKTFGDFEASLNKASAITGATGDDFENLKNKARDLGATTQFSASQAADAITFLGQAGFSTDKILDSLDDTLKLAAASGLDLGRSADIVSNVLTGFRLETSDLGKTVDILSQAFTTSNQDLDQLSEALKFVGPVAASFGTSIEESVAAIGALSDAGLQGSVAGTGLRRVLSVLGSEAGKLGVATTDSAGKLRPLADIIEDLEKKGLTASQALEIFGDRGGPAISVLLAKGSQSLREYTKELENSGGTADRLANVQAQGLNGALRSLSSAFQELQLRIGESGLGKAVENIINSVTEFIRKLGQLDDTTIGIVTAIGAVAAAIGPLLLGIGSAIKLIPIFISGIGGIKIALAALTGPIGLTVLAVGALGVAVVKNWDTIKETLQTSGITDILKELVVNFKELGATLLSNVKQSFDSLKVTFREFLDILKPLVKFIQDQLIKQLKFLAEVVSQSFGFITDLLRGDFSSALLRLEIIFISIFKRITEAIQPLLEFLGLGKTVDVILDNINNKIGDNKAILAGREGFRNYRSEVEETEESIKKLTATTDELTKSTRLSFEEYSKLADLANEKVFAQFEKDARLFNEELRETISLQKRIEESSKKIAGSFDLVDVNIDLGLSAPIQEFADEIENTFNKIEFNISDLSSAFSGLGNLIGSTFNNIPLGSFIGQFAQFAAKLVASNFKIATSSSIAGASQSALATGPAAAFTLPAFIASAVGLVASAFSAIGGGSSRGAGGGAAVGSGISETFGGGATGFSPFVGDREIKLVAETDGAKLKYVIDQANAYQN